MPSSYCYFLLLLPVTLLGCNDPKGSCFAYQYEADAACWHTETAEECFADITGAFGGGWRGWDERACDELASCYDPSTNSEGDKIYSCEDIPTDMQSHESCLHVEEGMWYLDNSGMCTPCDETSSIPEHNLPIICENNIWIAEIW